jgi:putative salt-induced outer membrane protein YdiY
MGIVIGAEESNRRAASSREIFVGEIRRWSILLSMSVFLACPVLAGAGTDVIVMSNGDHITGKVKNLSDGVLLIDLDYVDGTLSVNWLKVARIESTRLFLIRLQDGSVYSGKVITPETLGSAPMKIEILPEADQNNLVVNRSSVVEMTPTSESFLQRFSGELAMGTTYTKGNKALQYNLGSELIYEQARWNADVRYNSNLSSSTGADTATRNQLDFAYSHLMRRKNYFYSGLASFLQSSVQGIQRQTSLGGGLGVYLKNTNRVQFSVIGGPAWQRTNYAQANTASGQQDIAVALFATNLRVFIFKKTRLDVTGSAVPAVTDPGRVFYKTNMAYYIKLFSKIDWNLSLYGNWDTQPPPNFKSSDTGASSGISWTFGNK